MAEIARWGDHVFEVSPSVIRSFEELKIKGSSETEDKLSEKDKYVSRKNGKPSELSLAVILNAFAGCSVQSEALRFLESAKAGKTGYFYMGGKKLLPYQMMLTEAQISETEIRAGGIWTTAKVQLSFKQAGRGESAADSGGKKRSVRTPDVVTPGAVAGSFLNRLGNAVDPRQLIKQADVGAAKQRAKMQQTSRLAPEKTALLMR